jgi:hypothetical protein
MIILQWFRRAAIDQRWPAIPAERLTQIKSDDLTCANDNHTP